MPTTATPTPLVVFDFVRPPSITGEDVVAGRAPGEALLGYIQLQLRGWRVESSHDRWQNSLGGIRQRLAFRTEIPSLRMIRQWGRADVIVVTTRISLTLALTAKLLGKPLLFLDAMCGELPRRRWKRWVLRQALRLSDACLCLSDSQAQHWTSELKLRRSTITTIPFALDANFYATTEADSSVGTTDAPYVMSVGRDPNRDFKTFVSAVNQLDLRAKLVTKPYLIPAEVASSSRVEVMDGLSYPELFKLYRNALAAIIPVKRQTTFMSGIRATLEAMLLGTPVVLASTPGMRDYFRHDVEVLFYEPEDPASLADALRRLASDSELRQHLTSNARRKLTEELTLDNYVAHLERTLLALSASPGASKPATTENYTS